MNSNGDGLVRLRVGDVLKLQGGMVVVDLVNECGARVIPVERRAVTVCTRFGDEVRFDSPGRASHISAHIDPEWVVERRGAQWLKDFLAAKAAGRKETVEAAAVEAENQQNEEGNMAKKKKDKKERVEGDANSKGKLGSIMGYSVSSVVRRLGMQDVGTDHTLAILKAQGISLDPKTARVNIGFRLNMGKNGKGAIAPLTKDQVNELVASAPEPASNGEAKEPKKRGRKAKKEETAEVAAA